MFRFIVVVLFSITLFSCSGGGDNPSSSGGGSLSAEQIQAQALANGFISAYERLYNAQFYPMVLILGDIVTDDPNAPALDGTQLNCLSLDSLGQTQHIGTFAITLNDSSVPNNAIDPGESSDVDFLNCYSSNSDPVAGSVHQDLISYSADIDPTTLFPKNIIEWNADYTYSNNFHRHDSQNGGNYNFDGTLRFKLQNLDNTGNYFKMTTTADNLTAGFNGKSIFMQDLSIQHDTAPDVVTGVVIDKLTISGSFNDSVVGNVTVTTAPLNDLRIEDPKGKATLRGTLTLKSATSTLTLSFSDWNDITMSLNGISWHYQPGGAAPTTLIGNWDIDIGGSATITNSQITMQNLPGQISGSYVHENGAASNSLLWSVDTDTASTNISVPYDVYCIYDFSVNGFDAVLTCSPPGVNSYPSNINDSSAAQIGLYLQ